MKPLNLRKALSFFIIICSFWLKPCFSQTCQPNFTYVADTVGGIVHFTNTTSSYTGNNYYWNFGDGTNSSVKDPVHTFTNGNYQVCLYIQDSVLNCFNQICQSIQVTGAPKCVTSNFSFYKDSANYKNVFFTNQSIGNILNYSWSFGDSANSTSYNPSHIYANTGNYNVCLSVSDSLGCSDTKCFTVNVNPVAPPPCVVCNFTFHNDSVNNKRVFFTNQSTGNVINYSWLFGDSTNSSSPNPSHIYANTGNYNVCLTVNDSSGCVNTKCFNVNVGTIAPPPCVVSNFTFHNDSVNNKRVFFTNQSTGNVINYSWLFGDSTNSSSPNPSHIYANTGNYNVCLTVNDSSGCVNTKCFNVNVGTIAPPPCVVSNFTFHNDSVNNKRVFFTNQSTGNVINYSWSFGDSTNSTSSNPSHIYTNTGNYNVCLTVSDSSGCFNTKCFNVNVGTIAPPPCVVSNFTFHNDSVNNKRVFFTNQSTGNVINYSWSFGDSTNSTSSNPSHIYTNTGNYNVCLTVSDSSGCFNTKCFNVNVGTIAPPPCVVSNFTFHNDSVNNKRVFFTNQSTGNVINYSWSFGDSTNSTSSNPSHIYANTGNYNVCLTVNDSSGCFNTKCFNVNVGTIAPPPCVVSNFTFHNDSMNNKRVFFTNQSTGNVINYSWSFGDSTNSTSSNPSHIYANTGNYNVCLTVSDSSGCFNTKCFNVNVGTIAPPPCVVSNFTFHNDSVNNKRVFFTNQSTGNVINYSWSFGDSTNSTTSNPSHIYANTGNYNVCLTVSDSSGCFNTKCFNVNVGTIAPPPCVVSNFTFHNDSVNNKRVFFTNQSTGNVINYSWSFGDSTNSTTSNPSHIYANTGNYNVCLTVNDSSGCFNTKCFNVNVGTIAPPPCVVSDYTYSVDSTQSAYFSSNSQGHVTSYKWNFGDGSISTVRNPFHHFLSTGLFNVCLEVSDSLNCKNVKCKTVKIQKTDTLCNLSASFNSMVDSTGMLAHFSNSSTGSINNYSWNFGDGNTSFNVSPTHQYSKGGYYNVCLTVKGANQCQDYLCTQIFVKGTNPCSIFSDFIYASDSTGNLVLTDNSSAAVNFFWNFGDGNYGYTKNTAHKYLKGGYYNVCLTIKDSNQCQAQKCMNVHMNVSGSCNLDAGFTHLSDSTSNVYFKDNSIGNITNYYWSFGDGSFAYGKDQQHHYTTTTGFVNACLSVLDSSNNCQSTHCEQIKVGNIGCKADFSYYPDSVTKIVKFTENSLGTPTNWYWEFGDGSVSSSSNPSHTYVKGGYYNVKLTIYNSSNSCQNQIEHTVYIGGTDCKASFSNFPDVTTKNVHFTDQSIGLVSNRIWDFGDGSPSSSAQNPEHKYINEGIFHVCLTIYNSSSACNNLYCEDVTLGSNPADCQADFTAYIDSATQMAKFIDKSFGNINKWHWDYGDGSVSELKESDHQYTSPGYYTVNFTVENQSTGCFNTYSSSVTIGNAPSEKCNPYFEFFADQTSKQIHFQDKSFGSPNAWAWEFGDSAVSAVQSPVHQYTTDGYYESCMTITNASATCHETFCDIIAIGQSSLKGGFSFQNDSSSQKLHGGRLMKVYPIHYFGMAYGQPAKWKWEFGDGSLDSLSINPTHDYTTVGDYNVCLTVSDNITNQLDKSCGQIHVADKIVSSIVPVATMKEALLVPNPANNGLSLLSYNISSPTLVEIHIQDIYGRLINLGQTNLGAGRYDQVLDAAKLKLSAGIYMITITSNDAKKTLKWVVQ